MPPPVCVPGTPPVCVPGTPLLCVPGNPPAGGPQGLVAFGQLPGGPLLTCGQGGSVRVLVYMVPSGAVMVVVIGSSGTEGEGVKTNPGKTPAVTLTLDIGNLSVVIASGVTVIVTVVPPINWTDVV